MKTSLITLAAALASTTAVAQELPQANNDWFKAGQNTLAEKLAIQPNTKRAKNIILLVADGMGVSTNYAMRLLAGQKSGGFGDDHVLHYENFPALANVKTYNINAQTPDSAGTATSMNTGVKTTIGVIGVDGTLVRGDCAAVEAAKVANLAEILTAEGKAFGVVSTARITHATPAGTYAHSADRNFEDNSKLPEGCNVPDIASQLLTGMKSGMIDIALGGGRRHFIPKDVKDEEGKSGKRTDGRNLIEEAAAAGIQYVWNEETAAAADLGKPVLGLFHSSHMQYEHDRSGEPSLAEMTKMAITALQDNDQGFYLMIEAGRVDHANHNGNLYRTLTDGLAFVDAVAMADKMTNDDDTLIIVTSDHAHALAFNGYCGRGSSITGLCMKIDPANTKHTGEPLLADDGKPYTVAGYLNGSGSILRKDMNWAGVRPALTEEEANDPDYIQQALVPKSSETHSGVDVQVFAKGPWAHLFEGIIEQNFIYHVMDYAAHAK